VGNNTNIRCGTTLTYKYKVGNTTPINKGYAATGLLSNTYATYTWKTAVHSLLGTKLTAYTLLLADTNSIFVAV
jgi:hypothetical protein